MNHVKTNCESRENEDAQGLLLGGSRKQEAGIRNQEEGRRTEDEMWTGCTDSITLWMVGDGSSKIMLVMVKKRVIVGDSKVCTRGRNVDYRTHRCLRSTFNQQLF